MNYIIQAQNIYKFFGKIQILKGVNIFVNRGEILSIIGSSGAGKSTLLQILGTLEQPTLQKDSITFIKINGIDISYLSEKKLSYFRNKYIGFIFQSHYLLPEFTALENVCLPGFITQINIKEIKEKAKYLLNYLNMSHRFYHKPSTLSGGEQQRVVIARALINNPKIIFADEPSGNLDIHNSIKLYKLFFSLREIFQQTFVIVTHNTELASISDRKLKMDNGLLYNEEN